MTINTIYYYNHPRLGMVNLPTIYGDDCGMVHYCYIYPQYRRSARNRTFAVENLKAFMEFPRENPGMLERLCGNHGGCAIGYLSEFQAQHMLFCKEPVWIVCPFMTLSCLSETDCNGSTPSKRLSEHPSRRNKQP